MKKLKVVFSGPVFENTGFSWAGRSYLEILESLPIDLYIIPEDFLQVPASPAEIGRWSQYACRPFRNITKAARPEPSCPDVMIVHWPLPDSVERVRKGMTARAHRKVYIPLWECSCYPSWFLNCHFENIFDEFASPCEFVSDIPAPFEVTSILPYYHKPVKQLETVWADKTTVFYSIAHYVARKNIAQMVRCFCEAFTRQDNVRLIYKMGDQNSSEYVTTRCAELLKITRKYPKAPHITVLWGRVSDADMAALHQSGDIFYQLQHSEGWGVPHVEALMYGHPLVTCGYGAVNEYANINNSFMIPYDVRSTQEVVDRWTLDSSAWFYNRKYGDFQWGYVEDSDVIRMLRRACGNTRKNPPVLNSWASCRRSMAEFLGIHHIEPEGKI